MPSKNDENSTKCMKTPYRIYPSIRAPQLLTILVVKFSNLNKYSSLPVVVSKNAG